MSAAAEHRPWRSTGRSAVRARPGDGQDRRDRLEQFHATLSGQVVSLTSSTAWTDWLRTAARFHHYSFNNTIAIWMQRPDATQVAGYRTWQSMGRQVRKGEHGIQILAPLTRPAEQPDPDPGQRPLAPSRSTAAARDPHAVNPTARQIVGVRIAHVFDYAQTDGEPLAGFEAVRPTLLTGQAPEQLWEGLALQVSEAGYALGDLVDEVLSSGANGRTDYTDRLVQVRAELEPAQRVKTLAHELGHVVLHEPQDLPDPATNTGCRGRKEVEAESVAFLVTSARGMDSSQFSFPYVAGWALQSKDVEATLRETANRALTAAHRILDLLDRDTSPLEVAEDETLSISPAPRRTAAPERHTVHALDHASNRTPDAGMSR